MYGPNPCSRQNCTWSPEWRTQCEAREVMGMTREARTAYYADVQKRRGEAATKQLIEEVNRQWSSSQQSLL